MKKRFWILIVVVLVASGVGLAVRYTNQNAGAQEAAEATVSVVEVSEGAVSVRVEGPALVEPFRMQAVRSGVSGTVNEAVTVGDSVEAGQVVVRFSSTDQRTALAQAELNLEQAELDVRRAELAAAKARADEADKRSLFAAGTISRDQVDAAAEATTNAQMVLESAGIKVRLNQLAVEKAQADLEATSVRAPFSGVVLSAEVAPGDVVGNTAPLLTLADLTRLRLAAEVDEFDIGKIEVGMQVTVTSDALGDESMRAKVEQISPAAEVVNNISIFSVTTVIRNEDGLLRPGMSADMSILVSSDRGIVVPAKVVSTVRGRSYLDIYQDGEVVTTRVVAGANDGVNVAITEGLEDGALVALPETGGFTLTSIASEAATSIVPISVPGTGSR